MNIKKRAVDLADKIVFDMYFFICNVVVDPDGDEVEESDIERKKDCEEYFRLRGLEHLINE